MIMDILAAAYPRFYCGPEAPDRVQVLKLWAEMFANDDVALVAAAVKCHIASDRGGYPPHIGAIKNEMAALTRPAGLDAAQAWELVRRAVSNSGYDSQEEYNRLPEEVRRAVGSPGQLYQWSQMDSSTFHSVVSSHFRKTWEAREAKRRQEALVPEDVRRLMSGLAEPLALPES